ncbi:hypothetical protein Aspvir_009679 [Aspergillus viridinutans]|uniref:NAD(P)-binding protein n=1 Tax=Aspergillus viridinutans TaxID=75553 RepID=A0A9P3C5H7_ASPVI|nr:uncharacterized protein Aspvir_009679 [Aspergillus viridinutans]GIK05566.1 hypothetical protein Aspvir_009679 [Aspergillus viridinutans]
MTNLDDLPDDYYVKQSAFTKALHRDIYHAIDPLNEKLSQKGKVVVITGASQGIGQKAFAASFAKAGSKTLYLTGRSVANLEETKKLVYGLNPNVEVVVKAVDVQNESQVAELFHQIKANHGKADVLINNAGCNKGGPIGSTSIDGIWTDFVRLALLLKGEVMVKGTLMVTQHFLKLLGGKSFGYIINITSAGGVFFTPGPDSYGMCKLLELQMQRYIAALNPNVLATALHPGSILTEITAPAFIRMSKDTFDLAGGTALWLATEEARFMNSRYMSVNWDVEELVERQKEIVEKNLLTMELKGHFGGLI